MAQQQDGLSSCHKFCVGLVTFVTSAVILVGCGAFGIFSYQAVYVYPNGNMFKIPLCGNGQGSDQCAQELLMLSKVYLWALFVVLVVAPACSLIYGCCCKEEQRPPRTNVVINRV